MFSIFKHHGPGRALIVSKDPVLRQEIAVALSTYGFVHDTAETRRDGLAKFITYKHALIISDADLLPRFPHHLEWLYREMHRVPLTLITVTADTIEQTYPYLTKSAYDLLHLPLDMDDFIFTLDRALEYNTLKSDNLFLRDAFFLFGLALPLLAILGWLMIRGPS